MGDVYRARDTKLQRDVALKILPTVLTDGGELLFLRMRWLMSAHYSDGRLASAELLESAVAVAGPSVLWLSSNGMPMCRLPEIKRRSLVWVSPDGYVSDAGFGQRSLGAVPLSPDGRRTAIASAMAPTRRSTSRTPAAER